MSSLVELVYLSAASQPLTGVELGRILETSRRNNRAADVTGLLLHAEGSFLQVLEGPPDAVASTFARIGRDPRHHKLVQIFHGPIVGRSFAAWQMGYEEPRDAQRAMLVGVTNVLALDEGALAPTVTERIRALVGQFRRGRWRQAG